MNDEKKKKDGKPIGGITQQTKFSTFGHQEVQISTGSEVQTASTPNVKRSKHPEWKQQTVYLPQDLRMWVRMLATQSETEVSEIVTQALL